jgi:hypothetical protein
VALAASSGTDKKPVALTASSGTGKKPVALAASSGTDKKPVALAASSGTMGSLQSTKIVFTTLVLRVVFTPGNCDILLYFYIYNYIYMCL